MSGAPWYRYGSVTVTQGSPLVNGVSTAFLAQVKSGDAFTLDGSKFYEIKTVVSNTQLELERNFAEATAANASYGILRNFTSTSNAALAAQLTALLASWQAREDQFRVWANGVPTGGATDNAGTGATFTAGLVSNTVGGNGYYPLSDATGATVWHKCPAASAILSADSDKVDGFHASQTPAASQIPVLTAAKLLDLPGDLTMNRSDADIAATVKNSSATFKAAHLVHAGSGAASSKFAYSQYKNLDANGQGFIVGHYGSDNFVVRDSKSGSERITITPAGGITLNGAVSLSSVLQTASLIYLDGGYSAGIGSSGSGHGQALVFKASIGNAATEVSRFAPATGALLLNATADDGTGAKIQVNGRANALQFAVGTGSGFAAGSMYGNAVNGLTLAGMTGSTNDLFMSTPAGTSILRVPTGTRTVVAEDTVLVGTGTNNASGAKLQVNGAVTAGTNRRILLANDGYTSIKNNAADAAWASGYRFEAASTATALCEFGAFGSSKDAFSYAFIGSSYADTKFRLLANGSVLIANGADNGTGAKLQVTGDVSLAAAAGVTASLALRGNGQTSTGLYLQSFSDGKGYLWQTGNLGIGFGTNNTERLTITAGGNILAGATVDNGSGAKLQVAGNLMFNGATNLVPVANYDITIAYINNTQLQFKMKGADGVVRSTTLTLS